MYNNELTQYGLGCQPTIWNASNSGIMVYEDDAIEEYVLVDTEKCQMVLESSCIKNKEASRTEQYYLNGCLTKVSNNSEADRKSKKKSLTHGIVQVCQLIEHHCKDHSSCSFLLSVTVDKLVQPSKFEVSWEELSGDNHGLKKRLEVKGMIFKTANAFRLVVGFLKKQALSCNDITDEYQGFYEKGEGKLCHSNEDEHFRESDNGLAYIKGIADSNNIIACQAFTVAAFSALSELSHKMSEEPLPVIVVVSPSPSTDAKELAQALGATYVSCLNAKTVNELGIMLNVVDISTTSQYHLNNNLSHIISLNKQFPMLVFAKGVKDIDLILDPESYVLLPVQNRINCAMVKSMASAVISAFLRRSEHLDNILKYESRYNDMAYIRDFETHLRPLVYRLLYVFGLVISSDDEAGLKASNNYCMYLKNVLDSTSDGIEDIVKRYLSGLRNMIPISAMKAEQRFDSVVAVDHNRVLLTTSAFKVLSDNTGVSSGILAQALKEAEILKTDIKYQKNVRLKDGVVPLYVLDQTALYQPGDIRLSADDFRTCKPQLMINLGECGSRPVYLAYQDTAGTDNANVYISGNSGSGKSYLIDHLAIDVSRQDIPVVYVTTSSPVDPIEGADIVELSLDRTPEDSVTIGDILHIVSAETLLNDDEMEVLSMFKDDTAGFTTLSSVVGHIRTALGEDDLIDSIAEKLAGLEGGIFPRSRLWPEILKKGKITYIVIDDSDDVDGDTASDGVIRSLFEYKAENDPSPCLFIVDECQEFDLSQGKPLSKLVLRKGRKFGYITVLASQYLTAEDARNIKHVLRQCETHIAFTPEDDAQTRKRLGISDDDKKWREFLSELPRYSFVAKGHVASERGYIDYPIVAQAPGELEI